MKTRFEKTLDVDHNTFSSWDTASTHTVDKIFSFSEECGNDHILDVINNVSRYIENNQYLVPLTLLNHTHASQYIEYLKTLINFYIDYEMNTIDPQLLTEDLVKFNDSKQVHQAMFLLASHCAISLFKILSEDEQYASFKNTSMSYFLVARTVVDKQKDYVSQ